jgi:predicted MFS family arabinose efflux permease
VPSAVVAVRLGVKPTVIVGLTCVAVCIILFGVGTRPWELDLARFIQGIASSFSWTGALAWLVAATPASRRGTTIGSAMAAATGGALFGPVLGAVASQAGIGATFGAVGAASLGLAVWAAATPAARPERPQPLRALATALRSSRVVLGVWFVVLPALLFGTLSVLAPLRMSHLGLGPVAIGGAFLAGAAAETVANVVIGRASDRHGPFAPLRIGLAGSILVAALLPWPDSGAALALLVVAADLAFGTFFTPGMSMLSHEGERLGLDYGYTFALVNLAWAPGQTAGAAGGGALAHSLGDKVPYLLLAGVCVATLALVTRLRA